MDFLSSGHEKFSFFEILQIQIILVNKMYNSSKILAEIKKRALLVPCEKTVVTKSVARKQFEPVFLNSLNKLSI